MPTIVRSPYSDKVTHPDRYQFSDSKSEDEYLLSVFNEDLFLEPKLTLNDITFGDPVSLTDETSDALLSRVSNIIYNGTDEEKRNYLLAGIHRGINLKTAMEDKNTKVPITYQVEPVKGIKYKNYLYNRIDIGLKLFFNTKYLSFKLPSFDIDWVKATNSSQRQSEEKKILDWFIPLTGIRKSSLKPLVFTIPDHGAKYVTIEAKENSKIFKGMIHIFLDGRELNYLSGSKAFKRVRYPSYYKGEEDINGPLAPPIQICEATLTIGTGE